jgi:hypothetical protein
MRRHRQSVIKQKYRLRHEDGSCGDALARKVRKYLKNGMGTVDLDNLQPGGAKRRRSA